MKKILITAALAGELKVAKDYYKSRPCKEMKITYLITGMWIHKTLVSLTKELSSNSYDFIINFWVCGYRKNPEECIQIVRSLSKESQKELMVPVFFKHTKLTSILCSETPIYNPTDLKNLEYVDMESYAIEMVCEEFKVGRIILKIPVDKVWKETEYFDISQAIKTLKNNLNFQILTTQVLTHLQSLPHKNDISLYISHYNLTFSENIIFEKYYFKYTSLLQKDFWVFFNENKHLEKKAFLSHLSSALDTYSLSA